MLSMNTLRVASVAIGSALLLLAGLANAQTTTIRLDARPGEATQSALRYAEETLGQPNDMGHQSIELAQNLDIVVKPRRAIVADEDVYLRVDLSNGAFSANPTVIVGTITPANNGGTPEDPNDDTAASFSFEDEGSAARLSSGGMGRSFAVFEIGEVMAAPAAELVGIRIAGDGSGTIEAPGDDIKINSGASAIGASISSYANADDALDQVGASSTFAGSGTIIHAQSGLEIDFKPADEVATSSVAHGFVRFTGKWASDNGGQARLGWLITREDTNPRLSLLHGATGVSLMPGDILHGAKNARWEINGPLGFGAFHVVPESFGNDMADPLVTPGNATAMCAAGAPNAADTGTLVDAEGELLIGDDGELPAGANAGFTPWTEPNAYLFCVNVHRMGAEAGNSVRIPNATYSAKAYIRTSADATPQMVGEGPVGSIKRNGATVHIAYLTTSEKHRQRVVIVNRGNLPISITDWSFQTEDGTEVELTAAAMAAEEAGAAIGPGETLVRQVGEMVNITGDSRRTAVTLSFNGVARNISVATTQVNLADFSTDTVMWPVE